MTDQHSFRSFAAALCGILGVLLMVGGGFLSMGERSVFDSGYFAERVAASLEDERVAAWVGEILTDAVVEGQEDLILIRPLISTAARAIVASEPFRAVVRKSAREAHQLLATESGHEVLLSVSDFGVILSNSLSARPDIAEKIPLDAVAILGALQEGPVVGIAARVLQTRQNIPFPLSLIFRLGLLLMAGSVFLARDRELALLRAGVAITASAAAILFVVGLGAMILERIPADPALGGALAGVWSSFMGGFWIRILVFGGTGLVMAAAATAFLERAQLDAIQEQCRRLLIEPSAHPVVRLGRGIFLTTAGGFAVFQPGMASRVLVITAGGVACFVGLREMCRLLVDPAKRLERQLERAAPERAQFWILGRRIAVGLLLAVLVTAGATWFTRPTTPDWMPASNQCNGSSALCDRPLNEVVFAGTHNSMGSADIPGWMFPNQQVGIETQLEDGVRAFMLDVMSGIPVGNRVKTDFEDSEAGRAKLESALGAEGLDAALRIRERLLDANTEDLDLYLCHGLCELGASRLVPVLEQFRRFLILNPGEVIILIFEDTVPPEAIAAAFEESRLLELVFRGPVRPPWPTLGEMVRTDQRILVLAENNSEGVPWYYPAFEVFQETPYHFSDPAEFSSAPNRGGTAGSLLLMNHWITTPPTSLPSSATEVNAHDFLMERVERFRQERGRVPNVIAVDFYRNGDLIDVVRELNGRR